MVKKFKKFLGLTPSSYICVHKLGSYFRGCIYLKPYKHITLSANTPPPSSLQNGKKFKKFLGLTLYYYICVHKLGSYLGDVSI